MTIGETIFQRRKELGLKQWAVAREAGISAACLSKIENGEHNPRPETYKAIQKVLGLDKENEEFESDSPLLTLDILEVRARKAIAELNDILNIVKKLKSEERLK